MNNILGTLGNVLTGGSLSQLQAEAADAQQQITLAVETIIGLLALQVVLLGLIYFEGRKSRG